MINAPVISPTALLHDRVVIEPSVVVDAGVVFAPGGETPTIVRRGVHIAAGAVIGPAVELGREARVQPGAVVLSSVPPYSIVRGNPAQIVGYSADLGEPRAATPGIFVFDRAGVPVERPTAHPLGVGEAAVYQMPRVADLRGALSVGEFGDNFPFVPKRYFIVFDVPSQELRGEHAHVECHQFLICIHGSCRALIDNGVARREVLLNGPDIGLYMPPLLWGTQHRYTSGAVVLVLASHHYDPTDYIRSYEEFRSEVERRTTD